MTEAERRDALALGGRIQETAARLQANLRAAREAIAALPAAGYQAGNLSSGDLSSHTTPLGS